MQVFKTFILACLTAAAAGPLAPSVQAQNARADELMVEMGNAARRGDKARLAAILPQVRGHVLEPWAVYWEMKARLEEASASEVRDVMQRLNGTYQEDRLRNDWLLVLGKQGDWANFNAEYPRFRMNDDREVRCYAILNQRLRGQTVDEAEVAEVRRNWWGIRDAEEGCTQAAAALFQSRQLSALDVWKEARLSVETNRARAAANAVNIVAPDLAAAVGEINGSPTRYLTSRAVSVGTARKELITLALIKLATSDAEGAARLLEDKWAVQLTPEERSWAWGVIGKQANLKLSPEAGDYFSKARNEHLNDDLLGWKARTALRATSAAQGWPVLLAAVNAMSEEGRKDPTWVYWKARALRETARGKPEMVAAPVSATPATSPAAPAAVSPAPSASAVSGTAAVAPAPPPAPAMVLRPELQEANQLLESIASPRGFYEILATEELGRRVQLPPMPAPLTAPEREAARLNAGLNRALYAIAIGLRSDGVREWNYTTNLHTRGGMSERELLAAADFACQREVWDRCINTSERTKDAFNAEQRFPMPFRDAVVRRSREINLDPAYVYGLIRQESRFIMDARSGVGASGLMQVMPATARWTANKIGLQGFTIDQLNNRDVNIALGTAYLKLVLDDFQGSSPLAAAAYNAGPGRPRVWRNGPLMEGAAWAENVPFAETRDYVKKVAANATIYAAVLAGGTAPSIKARMGTVGPRDESAPQANRDLP